MVMPPLQQPEGDWLEFLRGKLGAQPGELPGQWALRALGSGRPLEIAGIPLGVLGSILQAVHENTVGRALALPTGLLTGQDPYDPQTWYRSGLSNMPLVGFALNTVLDPLTWMTLGGGTAARLATRVGEVAPGFAPAAQALVPINQAVERGIQGTLRTTGQAAGDVARWLDQAARQTEPTRVAADIVKSWTRHLLEESPATAAGRIAGTFTDVAHQLRAQGYRGHLYPIRDFAEPTSPGGLQAERQIAQEWDDLERMVLDMDDPVTKALGLRVITMGREAAARLRRDYALSRKLAGELVAEGESVEDLQRAAAEAWFTKTATLQEAARRVLERAKVGVHIAVPPETRAQLDQAVTTFYDNARTRRALALGERAAAETSALRAHGIAFDPASRASVEAGIRQLPQEARDALADQIDLIYARRDADIERYGQLVSDFVEHQVLQHAPGVQSLEALLERTAAHELLAFQRDLRAQTFGLREAMGFLPQELAQLGQQYEGLASKLLALVSGDVRRVARALMQVRVPDPGPAGSRVGEWQTLDQVEDYLRQRGVITAPQLSGNELVTNLRGRSDLLDPTQYRIIENAVRRWSDQGDLLVDDPFDLIRGRFYQAVLRQFTPGPRDLPTLADQVGRAFRFATRVWRENALAALSTQLLNLHGNLLAKALVGRFDVGPSLARTWEMFQNILANPSRPGAHWLPLDTQEFLKDIGWQREPYAVGYTHTNAILEAMQGNERFATERIPTWARMVLWSGLGAGAGPVGVVAGALEGLVAPGRVRLFSILARAIEGEARIALWQDTMERELAERVGPFVERAVLKLATPKEFLGGQVIQADPQTLTDVASWLMASKGRFSVTDLDALLRRATGGKQDEEINALVREWVEQQHAASKAGVAAANRVFFDYTRMTNLDEFVRQFVPFHIWASRAIPFYAERLASNPALAVVLARLKMASDQERERAGLGPRFENTVGMPAADWLARAILGGRPGEVRVNPFNVLFPFASVTGGLERASREESPLAQLLALASSVGFGVNPLVQIPLAAAGALGADQPLPTLNRYSPLYGLLPGATGPAERGWQSVVNRVFGRQPFDYQTYQTQKYLAERSIEETGQPIERNPALLSALIDPTHPAARQAAAEALAQRGRQMALNLLVPLSIQALPASEKAVGQARVASGLPQGEPIDTPEERAQYQQAVQEHPLLTAYSAVRGEPVRAELQRGLQVLSHPAALFPDAPPSFLQYIDQLWQVYNQMDDQTKAYLRRSQPALAILAQRQRQFILSSPILQAYLTWSATHPGPRQEGEPSREDQFLEWYRRTQGAASAK